MNKAKLLSRKLDLQRRGEDPRDLDPEDGKQPLRVKWTENLERLVLATDPADLRNATKQPLGSKDRQLRRNVSRLQWLYTLLPGRKTMERPVRITVEHPALCLSCEEQIEFGEPAMWAKDVGTWHEDCPEPHNLAQYQRDAASRRRLR